MIKQIHLIECDSTQDILKEQLRDSDGSTLLVSCDRQIKGRGRGSNQWNALPGGLCFSLTLAPHTIISLSALEISLLILRYFKAQGCSLKLKWPNDLWNEAGLKCGGILIQGIQNTYVAGIGLNLYSEDPQFGGVFSETKEFSSEIYARELAQYIITHRYQESSLLRKEWEANCGHMNQMVRVTENEEVVEGLFVGIGEHGEALLQKGAELVRLYNGSLRPI